MASVGHWRIHPDQPLIPAYERKASMSNGAVDLSTMPDGRRVSLRTVQQRAARKATIDRATAKRERNKRARARRKATIDPS